VEDKSGRTNAELIAERMVEDAKKSKVQAAHHLAGSVLGGHGSIHLSETVKIRKPQSLQTQVLLLNAKGFSNRRIARDLRIDNGTVARILKANKTDQGLTVIDALNAHGLTPEFLAQKLRQRIDATEVKTGFYEGAAVYSEPLVAWKVQHEAQDMVHELRGDYPQPGESRVAVPIQVVTNVTLPDER